MVKEVSQKVKAKVPRTAISGLPGARALCVRVSACGASAFLTSNPTF